MAPPNNPQPVLLPLGWPSEASEREAFTRLLLAAGADIGRMLDAPVACLNAFIRHAARLPMLRGGHENPIVALAPKQACTGDLLGMRAKLLEALPRLASSEWLVYLRAELRQEFIERASIEGEVFDAGGGLLVWTVAGSSLVLVDADTWVTDLASKLEELLTDGPSSGVMPIDSPPPAFHQGLVTTEPSPPHDFNPFAEMPYAAVGGKAARYVAPRCPSEFPELASSPLNSDLFSSPPPPICSSLPPAYSSAPPPPSPRAASAKSISLRPLSSIPPNPRLRKG